MNITIKGIVTDIFPAQQVTDSFKKRVIWVKETEGTYPNHYEIEFHQAAIEKLSLITPGVAVEVTADLRGKMFTSKEGVTNNFRTLAGWQIKNLSQKNNYASTVNNYQQQPASQPQQPAQQTVNGIEQPGGDDLPF